MHIQYNTVEELSLFLKNSTSISTISQFTYTDAVEYIQFHLKTFIHNQSHKSSFDEINHVYDQVKHCVKWQHLIYPSSNIHKCHFLEFLMTWGWAWWHESVIHWMLIMMNNWLWFSLALSALKSQHCPTFTFLFSENILLAGWWAPSKRRLKIHVHCWMIPSQLHAQAGIKCITH